MWNPDQRYQAEQARRAELEAEAAWGRRLIREPDAPGARLASITTVLKRLADRLSSSPTPQPSGKSRQ